MSNFVASGALNPEEHRQIIVHRGELDEIITHIENKDEYIVLQAPTQSGKTTLLYQIHSRLHQHGYGVVYLELSSLADLEPTDFYPMFCSEILDGLTEIIVENIGDSLDSDNVNNQISLLRYLRLVSEKTSQVRKLVFMVDELSNLSDEVTKPLFSSLRTFFTRGRGISNDRDFYKKVIFIFAGDLDLDKLIQDQNSPLRNICETFKLDDFSREQVLDLAQNLDNFSDEIIEIIAGCVHQWSDGHPSLTQCILSLIDESQECQNSNRDNIPVQINQLVKTLILDGSNPNLAHVDKRLRESGDAYCKSVADILYSEPEERKETVPYAQELVLMGIIKRLSNLKLVIRNKIYEEALKIFFDGFQLQDRT